MCTKAKWWLSLALLIPLFAQASPKIEHWTLTNGVRVYFVQANEIPMLQVRAVFDAGSARDPKDKAGLAQLFGAMLDEGAAGLTTDQIAARFEELGAQFGSGADRDMASVDLRTLSDPRALEPAVDLFSKILSQPTLPSDSLERERSRLLIGLAREAQSPAALAQRAFSRALYGDHPYGVDPAGVQEGLKRIARADLTAYHQRYFVGRNAWLAMIGNLSLSDAHRVAEKIMGGLPAGEPLPALATVKPLEKSVTKKISFPSTQSHVLVGQPGIARNDPDYFALYVGNYILGGSGLVSRLSNEIREKRGLSYSVYSYFAPLRVAGPFEIGLQTRNATRDQALTLLRSTLKRFIDEGPTPTELEAAKNNIVGGFPLRIDNNRKIADYLGLIGFYNMPLTYLDDFPARIQAVTVDQIRDAFTRRIYPDRMATVILGGER